MGCAGSKHEGNEALFLCKERLRFIKQAIDSRYALSAAQLSYTQSLRNVGVALRQFAECETLVESSLSTSGPDKSPSLSSYASPSPSRIPERVTSPRNSGSPLSPRLSDMSYMRASASSPLKFTVDSSSSHYVEEESLTFPLPPPPPPPPPDSGFSWDFFDPTDASGNGQVPNGGSSINQTFSRLVGLNNAKEEGMTPIIEEEVRPLQPNDYRWAKVNSYGDPCGKDGKVSSHSTNDNSDSRETEFVDGSRQKTENSDVNESVEALSGVTSAEISRSKREKEETDKEVCAAREDASKSITHRVKDFVSSIKGIEHRFNKAAESGHEVSRMLETKKIRLSISSEMIGKSSDSLFLSVFHPVCCKERIVTEHGTAPHVRKVITWNRSISSRSSSSRNHLTSASNDDCGESCSDFIEEFCMISGSHTSTLDRLYAWERKLYDEVKASESVRRAYDNKCAQLRHQFAKDMSAQVIDKTRATVKDLHSQVRVAIQVVDSISRRIEKLRDEELQPQLLELIQGVAMHPSSWRRLVREGPLRRIPRRTSAPSRASSHRRSQGDPRIQVPHHRFLRLTSWHSPPGTPPSLPPSPSTPSQLATAMGPRPVWQTPWTFLARAQPRRPHQLVRQQRVLGGRAGGALQRPLHQPVPPREALQLQRRSAAGDAGPEHGTGTCRVGEGAVSKPRIEGLLLDVTSRPTKVPFNLGVAPETGRVILQGAAEGERAADEGPGADERPPDEMARDRKGQEEKFRRAMVKLGATEVLVGEQG